MRYLYASIFLIMLMALSACGNSAEETKAVEKESAVEKASKVNAEAWEGEWIFLSNESLGNLQISNVVDNQFEYTMGATVIDNDSTPYTYKWEGNGVINGDEAAVSVENIDGCEAVFILERDQMIVGSKREDCQTDKISLIGTYKKKEAIEANPFSGIKEQAFYISGITLGMTSSEVKAIIGNPDYEGPEQEEHYSGFYNWIQIYPRLFMDYATEGIISIHATVDQEELGELLISTEDVEQYEGDDGTVYYYGAESHQLLILKDYSDEHEVHELLVLYEDGNFWAGVDGGWIRKVE